MMSFANDDAAPVWRPLPRARLDALQEGRHQLRPADCQAARRLPRRRPDGLLKGGPGAEGQAGQAGGGLRCRPSRYAASSGRSALSDKRSEASSEEAAIFLLLAPLPSPRLSVASVARMSLAASQAVCIFCGSKGKG